MLKRSFLLLFFLFSIISFAQVQKEIEGNEELNIKEIDSILMDTINLDEIIISKVKLDFESQKQFQLLQSRVYKTYPYAKIASERLTALNKGMSSLTTNKEKKKYFKLVEAYLSVEFQDQLKKLSRKQGQILVKLIHRQTGSTTYDLIKNLKNGWKAFWSNTTAKMFDLNLKTEYLPYKVNEDYLIETILHSAFVNRRLLEQKAANPVNIDHLNEYWENLAIELNKKKK